MPDPEMIRMVGDMTVGAIDRHLPGGVSAERRANQEFTDAMFDYYIARYGLPTDANAVRRMFEFAAAAPVVSDMIAEITGNIL